MDETQKGRKKVSLEGTTCSASDCCGATILYKLGDLGINGHPEKDARPQCINCQKDCSIVIYVLVRKDRIKTLSTIE
jgi:hypothetical protein